MNFGQAAEMLALALNLPAAQAAAGTATGDQLRGALDKALEALGTIAYDWNVTLREIDVLAGATQIPAADLGGLSYPLRLRHKQLKAPLDPISASELLDARLYDEVGTPRSWCWMDGAVEIHPPSAVDWTVTGVWVRDYRFTEPTFDGAWTFVDDTTVNPWTERGKGLELLVLKAQAIFRRTAWNDPEGAQIDNARAEEAASQVGIVSFNRMRSPTVTAHPFWKARG